MFYPHPPLIPAFKLSDKVVVGQGHPTHNSINKKENPHIVEKSYRVIPAAAGLAPTGKYLSFPQCHKVWDAV